MSLEGLKLSKVILEVRILSFFSIQDLLLRKQ